MPPNPPSSSDTLPAFGYNEDQLAAYIIRRLGGPVWDIELTKQQVLDAVQDSLVFYSLWRPLIRYQTIRLVNGVTEYLREVDLGVHGAPGLGVVDVDFVEPNPVPTEIFYGNLIDPAPLFRTGLDEYDTFLRWRKTWMRVTSVRPDWLYDEARQVLYIHNPIARYHCGVIIHSMWNIRRLPVYGADWVKRYALARARLTYSEILSKFSGALPGPVQALQLDQTKGQTSQEAVDKLEAEIKAAQESAALSQD